MNELVVEQNVITKEPASGCVYIMNGVDEFHAVMITGYQKDVRTVDLEDGLPWFSSVFDSAKEAEKALLEEGFRQLAVGSSLKLVIK